MKQTTKKALSLLLCIMLIAAMALTMASCNSVSNTKGDETQSQGTEQPQIKFTLKVIDADGKETVTEIETDKKSVGDALLDKGIIEGDNGQFGLYIKKVNGITADYDKDGTYWAFYVNGEYAAKGVDSTEIAEGSTYTLKIEK